MREEQNPRDRSAYFPEMGKKADAEFVAQIHAVQTLTNRQLQEHKELKAVIARAGFWGKNADVLYSRFRRMKNPAESFKQSMAEAGLNSPLQPAAREPLLGDISDPGLVFLWEYVRGLDELESYIRETGDAELTANLHRGIISRIEALRGDLADELRADPRD